MLTIRCFLVIASVVTIVQPRLRKEDLLADRVQRLTNLNGQDSIIRLKGDRYRRLVVAAPRNYSVMIMLTAASSQRNCPVCGAAYKEFQIVASSWHSSSERSNQLFFALADVDEAPEVFEHLRLNIAPVIVHYPAAGKPKKGDIMDMNGFGFAAEQIVRFVAERTQILIRIVRPPNYTSLLALTFLGSVVAALIYVKRDSLQFLFDPLGWAISIMMIIFVMISGQMWNFINSPPSMHRDPRTGELTYIYPDFQAQFTVETYIIIVLQAAILVGFILINEACSLKHGQTTKKIVALTGFGFLAVFFFLLQHVFTIKFGGYPYSLVTVLEQGFWTAMVSS